MKTKKAQVLAVDDEPRYVRVIKINLEASGYEVITADNGKTAIDLTINENPDLILLDLMMPGLDGYEVCRRIREFSDIPIIMLTALSETSNKVKGLDYGADDYITKPFSARELLARVRAALRRSPTITQTSDATFRAGKLRVNLASHRVYRGGQEVRLTPTEYRLLRELITQKGRVLVPEYLLEKVWGLGHEGETQLLWQAVHRLRQKIEPDPQNPIYIHTRPGIGYIFSYDQPSAG